jgi:predicted MFS family arabinose efflux permease
MQKHQSIAALAFGFVTGIGAFAVTGLLTEIAKELGTSVVGAGQLMSAYSFGLAVGAPLLTPLSRRVDRRTLISGGLVAFGALPLLPFSHRLTDRLQLRAFLLGSRPQSSFRTLSQWLGCPPNPEGAAERLLQCFLALPCRS